MEIPNILNNNAHSMANQEPQPPIIRQLLLFGVGWLGLNLIAIIVAMIIRSYLISQYIDPVELENALRHISVAASINIISYVILLGGMGLLAFDTTKKILKSFYRPSNIFKGIGYGSLILLSSLTLGLLYTAFGIELTDNANESTITSIMRTYPFFSFIAFVVAGPVCEELTYRLGLFGLLHRVHRYFAYAVTFVFFGLIHFDFETTNLVNELLNLPFYLIAGLLFCYIYEKEGLAIAMYAHMTNNLISFIFSLININILVRFI